LSIETKDIKFSYGDHEVLRGVSFTAGEGQLIALLGPNGVGKSTLFKCMLGLIKNYSGDTLIGGKSVKKMTAAELAKEVAYIPQWHYPSFNFSVIDMVLMGTTAQLRSSVPGREQIETAEMALDKMNILHLRDKGYTQISGGEQQLVLVSRALAQKAKTLIMDEPSSNLDFGNQFRIMAQIKELAADGYTVIESLHNPDQAYMYADRIIAIKGGLVIADGKPSETMDAELISRLYGIDVKVHSLRHDRIRICVPNSLERTYDEAQ